MLIKDYFSDLIVPLKVEDTGNVALGMMEDFRVAHLPVVKGDQLVGVISELEVLNLDKIEEPLCNQRLSIPRPYVSLSQHFFDVIRVAATEKLSLVPVLDDKDQYLGCITLDRMAAMMAEIASVKQPGGILVLEVSDQDYSLSEIARIVESNDAKVLSAYITSFPESTRLEITIKVNRIDLSAIIQTFNRYNYTITASFSEESRMDDLLGSRFDSLMNYLNV
ncbi:MAG: CBS domain-containing protein [Bacteroidales bacterium]